MFREVVSLWQDEFKGPAEVSLSSFVNLVKAGVYRVFVLPLGAGGGGGGSLAGMFVTSNYGQNIVEHVEYLAVSQACRGKGVGSILCQLLVHVLSSAKTVPKLASLECEEKLIPFYSRLGWHHIRELEPSSYLLEKDGEVQFVKYHFMTLPIAPSEQHRPLPRDKEFLESCRRFLQSNADRFSHL